MKLKLLFIACFFFALGLNAQIDSQNNSIAIPAEEIDDPKEDPELIIKPLKQNAATPDDTSKTEVVLPEVETLPTAERKAFSMTNSNEFKNPAELYTKQLQNALKLKEDRERRHNGSEVTQNFGKFRTSTKRINVMYRDHGARDGDLIRVYVNGRVAQTKVLLELYNKGFYLNLKPGHNVIDFEALNQGSAGPNTAEFQIVDGQGNIIISNQWNLATGVKATLNVFQD